MWSLPNIVKLNEDAAKNGNKYIRAVKSLVLNRKHVRCDRCNEPASHAEVWFDIFSDSPKGILAACDQCYESYGLEGDDCFHCADCDRTFVTNYSWELYLKHTDDGDSLCLNCYRERELANPDNWIPLTDAQIDELDLDQVRTRAKHLIANGQDVPADLKRIDFVEADSSTGGKLTSTCSAEGSPDGTVAELQSILRQAKLAGHKAAIIALSAYQFSVVLSVLVLVEKAEAELKKAA